VGHVLLQQLSRHLVCRVGQQRAFYVQNHTSEPLCYEYKVVIADMAMIGTYVLRLALLACVALKLATAACPVTYSKADPSNPLVFGSTYEACTSGCEPRDSIW
jgi:hypothetical protein